MDMSFLIVSGMSGSGKSTALKHLEDMGFFCVDNLPPALLSDIIHLFQKKSELKKIAIGIDVRGGSLFNDLFVALEKIKDLGILPEIIFLDSDTETLVKRYKESRRTHPLGRHENLIDNIESERKLLFDAKSKSHYIIDTSKLHYGDLKAYLEQIALKNEIYKNITISMMSFGFKYGIALEADLVFDVRFIKNPYYNLDLRPLTGLDEAIVQYVLSFTETEEFMNRLLAMLNFLIPHYIKEGKTSLVIAIGCTGGRHRSVVIAERMKDYLEETHEVFVSHRDIFRASFGKKE